LELFEERKKISGENYEKFKTTAEKLFVKLNNFIAATYKQKSNEFQ